MPASDLLPTAADPVRVHNGDCMRVLADLPAASFDAVLTDPPYGIDFQSCQVEKGGRFEKIANDDAPFVWWLRDAHRVARADACLVCFCRWDVAEAFRLAIGWAGFEVKQQLIWDKHVHGMGDLSAEPASQHEMAWFAVKGRYKFPGGRPTSVFRVPKVDGAKLVHPNEKPVPLVAAMVRAFTAPGDAVLEPFGGSGSMAVACLTEGRRCLSVELDPEYCATARARLAAKRAEGGQLAVATRKVAPPRPKPLG